jgi:hypothetical protein
MQGLNYKSALFVYWHQMKEKFEIEGTIRACIGGSTRNRTDR